MVLVGGNAAAGQPPPELPAGSDSAKVERAGRASSPAATRLR